MSQIQDLSLRGTEVPALQRLEEVEFDGQRFLVTPDTEETRRLLELDHAKARLLVGMAPLWGPAAPDQVNWEHFQTPCRNQGDRGTCWAFAAIAALEARYKRQFNLDLDLSEHHFFHLGRAAGLRGDYLTTPQRFENASSFWGYGGNSTAIALMLELASTEEGNAPYQSQGQIDSLRQAVGAGPLTWSPGPECQTTQEEMDLVEWDDRLIPRAARWNSRYRVKAWHLVGTDIESLEAQIAAGHEVIVDISLRWRFDAATDTYEADNNAGSGFHVVLLVGYDRKAQRFRMKNSWGEGRIVNVSYDFIRQNVLGATAIADVHPVFDPDRRQWWLGRWNMDHDGWRGALVIRRFANQGSPTKLGNYYRDGRSYDVNGFMSQGGLRASFTVAPSPGKKQPGAMDGQRFDAYVLSWDRANAAGVTTWNGIPFGAQLSRDPLPAPQSDTFELGDWVGVWNLNHDGWRGLLRVERIFSLPWSVIFGTVAEVTYRSVDGTDRPARAFIFGNRPHVMNLSISFDGSWQAFTLYAHSWERGTLSGTTQWGGATFGVIGRRAT